MKILWIFLGGSSQNKTIFRGHFYAFWGSFFKVKVQNGGYFGGLLKFQIFLGVLEIPVFFLCVFFWGGRTVDAGPEPKYEEKMRVPPPPPWDCRMTTTKSCRFVGGRDATVALPA